MARKKANIAWIANDAVRRITFKKRRRGLLKKVSELSILCGVSACAIIYGPHEAQPEVWPSESEARNILQHFKGLPVMEQERKKVNQEEFLQQQVKKLFEQFGRMEREIRERKIAVLMSEGMIHGGILQDVGVGDVATSLLYFIDMKLRAVYKEMKPANAQMLEDEVTKDPTVPAEIAAQNKLAVYIGGQWLHPKLFNFM